MKRIDFRYLYVLAILAIIVAYIYLYHSTPGKHYLGICWFKYITGYPCPACGSTRATYYLIHGNWSQAIWYNPLALFTNLFIGTSVVWMLRDIIKNKNTFMPAIHKKWPNGLLIFVFCIIAIVWIWNIYKGL